jgi:hypothetical protein
MLPSATVTASAPATRYFGALSRGPHARCLRFAVTVARLFLYDHARLASGWWPHLGRAGFQPAGFRCEVSVMLGFYMASSSPRLCLAHYSAPEVRVQIVDFDVDLDVDVDVGVDGDVCLDVGAPLVDAGPTDATDTFLLTKRSDCSSTRGRPGPRRRRRQRPRQRQGLRLPPGPQLPGRCT